MKISTMDNFKQQHYFEVNLKGQAASFGVKNPFATTTVRQQSRTFKTSKTIL